MSDTSITDKYKRHVDNYAGEMVPVDICEELERKANLLETALKDATASLHTISKWSSKDFDFLSIVGYANSRMTVAQETLDKLRRYYHGE